MTNPCKECGGWVYPDLTPPTEWDYDHGHCKCPRLTQLRVLSAVETLVANGWSEEDVCRLIGRSLAYVRRLRRGETP